MNITKSMIDRHRKTLISKILKRVKPVMWETGYAGGKSGHLKCFIFPGRESKDFKYHKIVGFGKSIYKQDRESKWASIMGFTEDGAVVTDAHIGLFTEHMDGLCLEDLMALSRWVINDKFGYFKSK